MNSVGITDPISYISRMQLGKELIALSTCSIGSKILVDVSAAIEESIASGTWIDIMVRFIMNIFFYHLDILTFKLKNNCMIFRIFFQ
jgi:hypothetical protein